jgi:predicted homoserine dehydrogenase-like protein
VTAAGKGTKYLPSFHAITPDTVWEHRGMTTEQARAAGMNAKMFTSFTDGTKAAIEMAAIANAALLDAPPHGLAFPPAGVEELPTVLRPTTEGGALAAKGQVEVVSSVRRDGSPVPNDLRWGVFAVFEGDIDYVRRCFREYGVRTDPDGRYGALHRPYHLIGLELGVSIASVALRREPTGMPRAFRADVVAVAKRDLPAGTVLDGEGGYSVWGKCVPARASVQAGWLPVGLAHDLRLTRPIRTGETVRWADVQVGHASEAIALRRSLEEATRGGAPGAPPR